MPIVGPTSPIFWEIVRRLVDAVLKDPKRIESQKYMERGEKTLKQGVRKSGRRTFLVDRRWD